MSVTFFTKRIWEKITATAKNAKGPAHVAIAYFGNGGSKLLPLKPNSILLVDASEGAVNAGQTDPIT
jgi:hypothetical protein